MVKGGGELWGFPSVDGQLGLHSYLGLFVDTGCLPRAEMGEGSSFCSPEPHYQVLTMKASLRMHSATKQALLSKENETCPWKIRGGSAVCP